MNSYLLISTKNPSVTSYSDVEQTQGKQSVPCELEKVSYERSDNGNLIFNAGVCHRDILGRVFIDKFSCLRMAQKFSSFNLSAIWRNSILGNFFNQRHSSLKVPNVEFIFNVWLLTLMHWYTRTYHGNQNDEALLQPHGLIISISMFGTCVLQQIHRSRIWCTVLSVIWVHKD